MITLNSSSEADDKATVQSTYGALFFGVPAQGMNVKAMASVVQGGGARFTLGLLDQQRGFRLRGRQHEEFCKAFPYNDSKIIQFFETKESPTVVQVSQVLPLLRDAKALEDPISGRWTREGKAALLVNPDSTTCRRGWEKGFEYQYSLMGDHLSMIKFGANEDSDYSTVRKVMRKFVQSAGTVIKNRLRLSTHTRFPTADLLLLAASRLTYSELVAKKSRSFK